MTLAAFRENRAAQKRRAILDAARSLFAEQGLGAVSMATLAGAAGVSTATLYRHFTAKEEVFGCVIDELVEEFGLSEPPLGEADSSRGHRIVAVGDPLRALALRYARLLSDPVVLGLLRALVADRDHGGSFRDRLDAHGNAILLRDFENTIRIVQGESVTQENITQSSLELRGAIEHISLVPGLLFDERLSVDALERQVDRIVNSWRKHWLSRAQ